MLSSAERHLAAARVAVWVASPAAAPSAAPAARVEVRPLREERDDVALVWKDDEVAAGGGRDAAAVGEGLAHEGEWEEEDACDGGEGRRGISARVPGDMGTAQGGRALVDGEALAGAGTEVRDRGAVERKLGGTALGGRARASSGGVGGARAAVGGRVADALLRTEVRAAVSGRESCAGSGGKADAPRRRAHAQR